VTPHGWRWVVSLLADEPMDRSGEADLRANPLASAGTYRTEARTARPRRNESPLFYGLTPSTIGDDSAARRSRWFSGRRLRSDQSNPKILTVAVGLSPRISYWTFTDVRRPLRPGASVAAVCPPALRVPRLVSVASLRLSQPR